MAEVLLDAGHDRVQVVGVDADALGPAAERLGREAARRHGVDEDLVLGEQQ